MPFLTLLEESQKRKERCRSRALQEAKRLSTLLSQRFSFERLYLFGSAMREGGFTRHSDLDLAIQGLTRSHFLKAYALLIKESDFPVDLKPWELLDEQTRQRVKSEAMVIYEKR